MICQITCYSKSNWTELAFIKNNTVFNHPQLLNSLALIIADSLAELFRKSLEIGLLKA